ncbi:hypothetical protein PISL3812_00755 [Talaromyces islandicus]|uniref:Cyanovirin-N domain-containing protein n=1 Tax=Talaromyces islandicus TaxID=28573 RepID=A0A0U1LK55_TALIS|nr:hypothetical protein PISL3812_00755 [Talaromyces islandicus]
MQFSALLAAAATLLATASAGGFSKSCTSCRLGSSNTLYGCLCTNDAGKEIYNIVDLNKCMVNVNGQLIARANGDFGPSCTADGQNDQYTPCWTCGNGSGTDQSCPTLDDFLSNQNGALVCDV